MSNRHSNSGFTLVEYLIVVGIMLMLVAIAIPAFQKVKEANKERDVINKVAEGKILYGEDKIIFNRYALKQSANVNLTQHLTIDGITYILVPNNGELKQITIGDKSYFLIPQ